MLVFLIGAVQFVNILDFVMVTPLGPKLAVGLGLPESQLGFIVGSYTAAAAVSGVLGAFFLERFDRKKALGAAMVGLVAGTALCGFATSSATLMIARVIAGTFGGPATSLALSIVADGVPPERRGKAMGSVMGAFSIASIVGVPVGLRLADFGGWRLPFFVVAGLGLLIALLAITLLPPMTAHLGRVRGKPGRELLLLLENRDVWLSYSMTALTMLASFLVVPILPPYLTGNLHYPANELYRLYALGGVVSFVTLRVMGRAVDRLGSFTVGTVGSLAVAAVLYFGFVAPPAGLPVLPFFMLFFLAMGTRNVSYNTLTSKVPRPEERARFMSLQSAVQHLASALGAFCSARLLGVDAATHMLTGAPRLGLVAGGLTLCLPVLLWAVERRVRFRLAPQGG
jgi:predicted MFS family arabinose efflux permease